MNIGKEVCSTSAQPLIGSESETGLGPWGTKGGSQQPSHSFQPLQLATAEAAVTTKSVLLGMMKGNQ